VFLLSSEKKAKRYAAGHLLMEKRPTGSGVLFFQRTKTKRKKKKKKSKNVALRGFYR
jgi:hypothetical protein